MTNDIILQAKGLKKYYGKGETMVRALDGVDLAIQRGKFTAIIGTSGSGKSLFCEFSYLFCQCIHRFLVLCLVLVCAVAERFFGVEMLLYRIRIAAVFRKSKCALLRFYF